MSSSRKESLHRAASEKLLGLLAQHIMVMTFKATTLKEKPLSHVQGKPVPYFMR